MSFCKISSDHFFGKKKIIVLKFYQNCKNVRIGLNFLQMISRNDTWEIEDTHSIDDHSFTVWGSDHCVIFFKFEQM
jgi:hypothetical protein